MKVYKYFVFTLSKKGCDLEDSIQERGDICILYEPCIVIVDCVYADWHIILIYALKYVNIPDVYFLKS